MKREKGSEVGRTHSVGVGEETQKSLFYLTQIIMFELSNNLIKNTLSV